MSYEDQENFVDTRVKLEFSDGPDIAPIRIRYNKETKIYLAEREFVSKNLRLDLVGHGDTVEQALYRLGKCRAAIANGLPINLFLEDREYSYKIFEGNTTFGEGFRDAMDSFYTRNEV